MGRYIDADALKERLEIISVVADDLYGMGINRGLDRAETEIDMLPTADVVEVVRCEKCKHLTIHNSMNLYAFCEKTKYRFRPFQTDTRTHFCSYGERKE